MGRGAQAWAVASCLLLAAAAAQATPWIFWLRDGELGRLAIDGSANQVLLSGASTPTDLAVDLDDEAIYWADLDTGRVVRTRLPASLDDPTPGPEESIELAGGLRAPSAVRLRGPWVYFVAAGGIYRVGRDGSGLERLVETQARDLAIAGDVLLWVRNGDSRLWRADAEGGEARPGLELPGEPADELAVVGDRLYFVDGGGQTLWRAAVDGAGAEALVELAGRERFVEIAPTAEALFWTQSLERGGSGVRQASLDGGSGQEIRMPRLQRPSHALAVAGGQVYWSDSFGGWLKRADLDGENLQNLVPSRVPRPRDLAVADGWIYWTEEPKWVLPGAVRRCRVDGSDVELVRSLPQGRTPDGLAVLDGTVYWRESANSRGPGPSRIVGARPGSLGEQQSVYEGDLGGLSDLFVSDGQLHWLTFAGEVWRLGEAGAPPQRVEALPARFRRTRFGDPEKPLHYLAMARGERTFVAEGTRDVVFEVGREGALRLLAEDLYVTDVAQHGGELFYAGVEGIGRLSHGAGPAATPLSGLERIKAIAVADVTDPVPEEKALRGQVWAADGAQIAFSSYGEGDVALVLVHCAFCDQEVWREQVEPLAELGFQVVTLDLSGHGESSKTRQLWTLDAFANDVRAVTERLELDRFVLVGNSLGAPVALAAAARMPGQVLGVVAVDALHDATARWTDEEWQARIDAFQGDYDGACREMVGGLFHPDGPAALERSMRDKMCAAGPELTAKVLGVLFGYEADTAMQAAGVPVFAINGDLFPTNVEANRAVGPRYEARVLEGVGHFPQLEQPELFNTILTGYAHGFLALEALRGGGPR